jgi:hypothetical protein
MKIGDVTALANNIADEMNEEGADLRIKRDDGGEDGDKKKYKKNYELGAQKVGKIIRDVFQLHTPPRKGKGVFFEFEEMKMIAIGKKYAALPPEDKIEAARQAFALLRAKGGQAAKATVNVPEQVPMPEFPPDAE